MIPLLLARYWYVAVIAALVTALGLQTWRLKVVQEEFEDFRISVAALGEAAHWRAEATNTHHELVNEELEHEIEMERKARAQERTIRSDRFDSLYRKYLGLLNTGAGSGGVPEAGGGPGGVVHDGAIVFDATKFRASLERVYGELESREGGVALWGKWARLTGVCDGHSD